MHVKEGLVFDKHTGELVGFIDLGDTNNYIAKLERATSEKVEPLSKSLLVLMVGGLSLRACNSIQQRNLNCCYK